jgi:two-component system, cell cycle sensor histidine kinase PleC
VRVSYQAAAPIETAPVSRHNHFLVSGLAPKPQVQSTDVANDYDAPWQREFLEIFLRGQISLAFLLPLLTIAIAATAAAWTSVPMASFWAVLAITSQLIQIYFSHVFLERAPDKFEQRDWIAVFSATEALQAMCLSLALFLLWPEQDLRGQFFLLIAMMTMIVMRFLIGNNYMPVLIAGTGTLTVALALRCFTDGSQVFLSVAVFVIVLETIFLLIARNMQRTTRDMIKFRHQKDKLIVELRQEKEFAEQEHQKAVKASLAKSVFLANMSHELRTPLNAILGFSEILDREMFGPLHNTSYKEYAGDIHHSGQHLLSLINDILDLSRIEAGRRDLREEPLHMLECAEEAIKLTQMRAAAKNLTVQTAIASDLPKLLGDRRAIEQIMINLLTNAVKFTPDAGDITLAAQLDEAGDLVFSVTDTGPGIPEAEITQALTAFTRGTFATKSDIDGVGLGLPIVKGLIELHGGYIDIRSQPRVGTQVRCIFPQKRVLSGPRGQIITGPQVQSESQRKLLKLTG